MTPERFRIPGGTRFRRHEHEAVHLVAVLDGGLVEFTRRGPESLGPGDLRLSPATSHDLDFDRGGALCLVLELAADAVRPPARSLYLRGDARLAALTRLVADAERRADPAGGLATEGLTVELLAAVERRRAGRTAPPPSWLGRVRQLLHDEPTPPPVHALAAAVGVHRVSLARAFRDHMGTTVTAYAARLRVERAVRAIVSTDTPLAMVAAGAGFADQAHLTRAVRARTGTTPGALRRTRTLPPFKTNPRHTG